MDWMDESIADGFVRSDLLAVEGLGFYGNLGLCLLFERPSGPVDFWPLFQSGGDPYSPEQDSWEYVGRSIVPGQRPSRDSSSGEHH